MIFTCMYSKFNYIILIRQIGRDCVQLIESREDLEDVVLLEALVLQQLVVTLVIEEEAEQCKKY